MGCDYYIVKVLHIYYNETDYLEFEINRKREYYYYEYDSDEEDYEDKVNEYKKNILTPVMKPIILYTDNGFIKPSFEEKYKDILEEIVDDYDKKCAKSQKL
jgi:chromosomal replication initiation ATPase DnaA